MHVKRIHEMMEKLTKCAEMEFEKGVENVDTKEMGEVVDIIKDLAEAEYYAKITKAMDEAEYGEEYDYMGAYEDDIRKGYRGQPRDSRGRYMSRRGRGGRRGYEEPMEFEMTPELYHMYPPEYWRDMDKNTMGRMYYTEGSSGGSQGGRGGQSSGGSSSGMSGGSSSGTGTRGYEENYGNRGGNQGGRDSREGRSGQSRRGYMEAKEMGKDKQSKMKELEEYMKELSTDVTEMIGDASPEEKNMLKSKMQTLLQKIQ